MTQFNDVVEKQRIRLAAEEWAKSVETVHAHRLNTMYYDNRPEDTVDGGVIDITYKTGLVERTILKTGEKVFFGKKLEGEELIQAYMNK